VTRRTDVVSLTAGIGVALLGILLLLDQTGALDVTFAAIVPLACAVVGSILLVSGLTRGD
jgi:hypothetical protein